MTWEPVNLAEVAEVNRLWLLAAIADGRARIIDDPDNPGWILYTYTLLDDPEESAGPFVDEVVDLVGERLVSDRGGRLTITELGKQELDAELFMLEILVAIGQGRVRPNGQAESVSGRTLYAYPPREGDQFEGTSFSIDTLIEEDWVSVSYGIDNPELTTAGWHRLELFELTDRIAEGVSS
jgi:hypothetical protein